MSPEGHKGRRGCDHQVVWAPTLVSDRPKSFLEAPRNSAKPLEEHVARITASLKCFSVREVERVSL